MWTMRWSRRQIRPLSSAVFLCLVIGLWVIINHGLSRNHYLSLDLVALPSHSGENGRVLLSSNKIESTCHAHGFTLITPQTSKRKIYDLVLMYTELDWLEIRLHTLANHVDYFVIIESPTTFTGKPKPLYLQENWNRFKAFHHKIIYRIVGDSIQNLRIWDHEDYLRNALFAGVVPGLEGTAQEARDGDVLVVSDMDTIMPNDLRQGLLGQGWTPRAAIRRWWDRGTLWTQDGTARAALQRWPRCTPRCTVSRIKDGTQKRVVTRGL